MAVQALGYLGIGATNLDDWSDFAIRQLGMQQVDRSASCRAFRMDDRRQRLIVDRELAQAERYFGWEVADAAALDTLAARLEAAGVAVRRETAALADQRCVGGLISFRDPSGNRLEAFHGPLVADEPFRPGRDISGFRTGVLGMGHVVLMVADFGPALAFYQNLLGFRVSDFIRQPITACFLHVNQRHHSLALFQHTRLGLHHLMMEMYSLDDVGQGYDLAQAERDRVAVSLGRHPNDYMTSFYMRTPSNFLVEYGWGAREVDDATWQPQEMSTIASFWGHDGLIRSVAGDAPPPPHPPAPPPAGRRAPVQVMEGNYQRLSGVCPWWDATAGR
ncbi:MAG: biphenyl 2,3-dioxygenase [Rhodospirillales bacterium 70-18]|nr:VOC family protein [Rhodospirillales bacterium]OJY70947.1 MAG: biphenyl 2,3-dioxygenase [Rhodospirillales bacterium 70-18]